MGPMKTVLVTGAAGFVGSNLCSALRRRRDVEVLEFDLPGGEAELGGQLAVADVVFHLAGVNRPQRVEEFEEVNVGLTERLCHRLTELARRPVVVFTSSTQARLDNPYGTSKRRAEEVLESFSRRTGAPVRIYQLPGVFGKWCRPSYNSVVATFCHNTAHDMPVTISDPANVIDLVYIDDVVAEFLRLLEEPVASGVSRGEVTPTHSVSLGRLIELIRSFRESRQTLVVPDFVDSFIKKLYATYQSYLPADAFAYDLQRRSDPRGTLAELLKSPPFGQIFISRTRPGVTRGNHAHDTKVEKFCVIEGEAVIRFTHLRTREAVSYTVSGTQFRVVDIPPGWAHSIENVGNSELIVLFWAGEVFDPERPDCFEAEVTREEA